MDTSVIKKGNPIEIFSKNKSSEIIHLEGEFLKVKKEENQFYGIILLGVEILKIKMEETDTLKFKTGEKVLINFKNTFPKIEKLKK